MKSQCSNIDSCKVHGGKRDLDHYYGARLGDHERYQTVFQVLYEASNVV